MTSKRKINRIKKKAFLHYLSIYIGSIEKAVFQVQLESHGHSLRILLLHKKDRSSLKRQKHRLKDSLFCENFPNHIAKKRTIRTCIITKDNLLWGDSFFSLTILGISFKFL